MSNNDVTQKQRNEIEQHFLDEGAHPELAKMIADRTTETNTFHLSGLFVWSKTPEGYEYWQNIVNNGFGVFVPSKQPCRHNIEELLMAAIDGKELEYKIGDTWCSENRTEISSLVKELLLYPNVEYRVKEAKKQIHYKVRSYKYNNIFGVWSSTCGLSKSQMEKFMGSGFEWLGGTSEFTMMIDADIEVLENKL